MAKEKTDQRKVYEQNYVRSIFDSIAGKYDLLNHILSFGIDILWRRKAIKMLETRCAKRILDVATGTGDLAIEASGLSPEQIIGIDISRNMIDKAIKKVHDRKLNDIIKLEIGNAENLQFKDRSFDIVMSAFGVRNFENLQSGLKEFFRVLDNNGIALILEFSRPRNYPVNKIYKFYLGIILPFIGRSVSNNHYAYSYLHNTVSEFPDGEDFCLMLREAGFSKTSFYPLTFGIASIYLANK